MEVFMAYTEAKKISNQKSDAKYSQILLKSYKEEAARIKKCAADEGMSTQGYILQAVQNFPEEEYDKLRYELDKLIHETFSDEARKPKKAAIAQEEAEETQKPTKPLTCKSLIK